MRREQKYNNPQLNIACEELGSYRDRLHDIEVLTEKLNAYEDRYTINAIAYDKVKVQGGKQYDSLVETAIAWADLKVKIEQMRLENERTLWYIKSKLEHLEHKHAKVLELYYVKGYDQNQVARIMNYSSYWIKELKHVALEKYSTL